jgi:trk system potassium uptake protein
LIRSSLEIFKPVDVQDVTVIFAAFLVGELLKIVIAGAGEVGFLVASELYQEHDVTIIDKDPCSCLRLEEMDLKVLQGNAANARLLIEAGVKDADIVLAVTGNDEVNIITWE